MSRVVRKQLVVIGLYALLALVVLYNLIFHLSTHVPGTVPIDYYHFHWNYWWIRHALTQGLNLYETNYVMAPFTSSLALHTLTPFWYPLWALVEPLADTNVAMTAVFIAIYTLTGYTFYLLLRWAGILTGVALIGGLMLELAPIMFSYLLLTNINVMSWFWLPVILLLWAQIVRTHWSPGKRRLDAAWVWSAVLALALWGMVLTDIQFPLFAGFLVVPYGSWTLGRTATWKSQLRLAGWGGLALALAVLLLWFLGPLPYVLTFDRTGLSPTPAERAVSIPFPLGYLQHLNQGVSFGAVLIPALILALALSLRLRNTRTDFLKPSRWFWLALAFTPLVLSAGAFVTLGQAQLPMPYHWLHDLLGGMFRYPERFAPVFLIPAVLFIGLTLTPLLLRRPILYRIGSVMVFFIVLTDARAFQPMPIQPLPSPYHFYETMGSEPYDYVVVEVPTAGSSGEGIVGDPAWITTQWYGITHGKRMVNGHLSRVNTWRYWYMRTDDPMMAWLGQRRYIEPETVAEQLRERIFQWPIGYFVIHTNWIERSGPTLPEIIGYLNSLPDLLCSPFMEGEAIVYRTRWHPAGCASRTPQAAEPGGYQIDVGASGDEAYIGWGWHGPETVPGLTLRWMGEYPQTQVYLDLPPGNYEFSFSAQAFQAARRLRLWVNGRLLPETVMIAPDSLQTYTFALPAAAIGTGDHIKITFDYDGWLVPADSGSGSDTRKLALAVDWLRFARQ